jgi:hypothetical protein
MLLKSTNFLPICYGVKRVTGRLCPYWPSSRSVGQQRPKFLIERKMRKSPDRCAAPFFAWRIGDLG